MKTLTVTLNLQDSVYDEMQAVSKDSESTVEEVIQELCSQTFGDLE